jgi:hypothetical protein
MCFRLNGGNCTARLWCKAYGRDPPKAITGAQVIARAETWHPHTAQRIPCSQTAYHDGYRTDCSGTA